MKAFSGQHISRLAALLAAAGSLTLAAAATAAAQPEERGRDPIVVQGERLTRSAAEDRAARFIRTTGVASGETPAARWIDPICPGVTGLVDSANRYAEARIRRVAAAAGALLAPEPCVRNLVVSFTADGAGVARAVGQRDPRRVADLSPAAREALYTGAAPIRWMYTIELRSRDGRPQTISSGGESETNPGPGDGAGSAIGTGGLMHYESSIVSTLSQRVITSAIVIVDQDHVMGRRLDSLADYAALVGLAEIRAIGATPDGSILGMFETQGGYRNLTAQDAAFLRALYRIPMDREARQHRGALADQIADALTAPSLSAN